MTRYESGVEGPFCTKIKMWAREQDIRVETIKLNLQGRRGWPDRLILWPGGNLLFIEFKRVGEEPRKLQTLIHQVLEALGFVVKVYDNTEEALQDVKARILTTTPTDAGTGEGGNTDRIPPVP